MDLSAVSSHSRTVKECNWNNSNRRKSDLWRGTMNLAINPVIETWACHVDPSQQIWAGQILYSGLQRHLFVDGVFPLWVSTWNPAPASGQALYDCLTLKSHDHDLREVPEEQLSNHPAGLWTSTTCYPPNAGVCVWCVTQLSPLLGNGKSNSTHPGERRHTFKT